jgi:hypothetical protein
MRWLPMLLAIISWPTVGAGKGSEVYPRTAVGLKPGTSTDDILFDDLIL